jgi:hypothetical protein
MRIRTYTQEVYSESQRQHKTENNHGHKHQNFVS